MTWAKLSDTFNTDPVLAALSRGQRLLYVELLVWSCQQGTDGRVPRHIPARVSDEPLVDAALHELAGVGLVERLDDGWLLVRFAGEQISADEDAERREFARIRQERRRRHMRGNHTLCDPKYCEAASRVTSRDITSVTQGSLPDPPVLPDPPGSGRDRTADDDGAGSAAPVVVVEVMKQPPPQLAEARGRIRARTGGAR